MNLKSKLRNRHFLSFSGNIVVSVLSLVSVMILTRTLSLEIFGVWVFFQSILILVDTFRSGFITNGFIKFYSGASPEKATDVEGSAWFIALCITGIMTILNVFAFFLLPFVKDEGLQSLIRWFWLPFWVGLPFYMTTCATQASQRFDRLLVVRLISQGSFVITLLLLAFFSQLTLKAVIISYSATFGLSGIFCLLKGWISLGSLLHRTKATTSELFHFGKYTVGTILSANLFKVTDTLVINFWLGPAAMAVYNVGQRLMEIVEIPLRSFLATSMPELSALYNQDKHSELIERMKKYIGILTICLVPVCLLFLPLADAAILFIAGPKYVGTEAATVFRLFMTFALLYPAERFFATTLDVIHLPKINFYKVLIMLVANVVFDVLGVIIFRNVYGIVLATVVPTLIGAVVGYWGINRFFMRFSFIDAYRKGAVTIQQYLRRHMFVAKST
ncbi:MAG: lipopolysaccharide biosynthesis protein [Candidatus Dadabacteria bacterium]